MVSDDSSGRSMQRCSDTKVRTKATGGFFFGVGTGGAAVSTGVATGCGGVGRGATAEPGVAPVGGLSIAAPFRSAGGVADCGGCRGGDAGGSAACGC